MASEVLEKVGEEELARRSRAELCRRSLAYFTRCHWRIVEPGAPLVWNWHIESICRVLEAMTFWQLRAYIAKADEAGAEVPKLWRDLVEQANLPEGDAIRKTIFNIPPGFMKSLLVAVMWPAWVWTFWPEWRLLSGSYSGDLSIRDCVKSRRIITHDFYQQLFRPEWEMAGDQNVKGNYENDRTGFRMAISVGGAGTGHRGNAVLVDDPINKSEANSKTVRDEAYEWWTKTMPTRVNDKSNDIFIVVMQRLHEDDLTGRMLAEGGYTHLCLPMEYAPNVACPCGQQPCTTGLLGKLDPRTEPDELLFEKLYPPGAVTELKKELQGDYAGQANQRPTAAEGGKFKRAWWKYHRYSRTNLTRFDQVVQSWDFAVKDKESSSYAVGQVWGRIGADFYLLDQVRDHMDINASCDAVKALSAKWPEASAKYIEDKANGPNVIRLLRSVVAGLLPLKPDGDKELRAAAVSPFVKSGNVYIPDPTPDWKSGWPGASWVQDFLNELADFPRGAHDDQVDALSQALAQLSRSSFTAGSHTPLPSMPRRFGAGDQQDDW